MSGSESHWGLEGGSYPVGLDAVRGALADIRCANILPRQIEGAGRKVTADEVLARIGPAVGVLSEVLRIGDPKLVQLVLEWDQPSERANGIPWGQLVFYLRLVARKMTRHRSNPDRAPGPHDRWQDPTVWLHPAKGDVLRQVEADWPEVQLPAKTKLAEAWRQACLEFLPEVRGNS